MRFFELCAIIIAMQINSLYAQQLIYHILISNGEQANVNYYCHKIDEKKITGDPEFSDNSSFSNSAYSKSKDDSMRG